MSDRRIPAEGRIDARLVLIGEAGGEHEDRLLRPFVGASGYKLNSWWHPLGLRRENFWIDNVYPFRPANNDLAALLTADYEGVKAWADNLHDRLAALTDPYVIVPNGNIALRALMRRALDDRNITINKYRGSIMTYLDANGRAIKMIPTIHPAAIYHQRAKKARGQEKSNPGRTEKHCQLDWKRIADEATFREVHAPEETYYIVDQPDDLAYWQNEVAHLDPELPITIDIETPHKVVDCVGFSWDRSFAISVPLRWPDYNGDHITHEGHPTYEARRALIECICGSPNPKVLQNGPFDIFWLWRREGIEVHNYCYELMCMHAALDPVDDHDLGYMKSVFLRGEYHKDEAKTPEKAAKYADSYEACLSYNGMDCCTQNALYYEFQARLIEAGRWELYETVYRPLLPILMQMMLGGMNTSRVVRRIWNARLTAECVTIQNELAALAGEPLHAKKDLSRTKIQRYLYETLRLPVQHKRGARGQAGKVTTDEVALRKLQLRFPKQAGDAIKLILRHRRALKLASFLTDTKTDDDGRLRSVIMPLTEAGRCSSGKNPFGTGTNLQNQDRDASVRGSFIPDYPDHVLLEVDCSQAESRIVYVVSGDDALYRIATIPPDQFDQHCYNAALIFGAQRAPDAEHTKLATDVDLVTPLGYVTPEQRYFGKRTVHGAQRGMGGEKMADELLKEDIIKTPDECQRAIDNYFRTHPGIAAGYFDFVRTEVLRNKCLTNSWGFKWDVQYEQMNPELFRRAYSFWPQSEVAFLLNAWGLVPVGQFINAWYTPREARVLTQVHDSVLISVSARADVIVGICDVLSTSLTQPRVYRSKRGPRELSMPIEFKLGSNWSFPEGCEWKRLPTQAEIAGALTKIQSRRVVPIRNVA